MHPQGEAWVRTATWLAGVVCLAAAPVVADARQVDPERAAAYFKEAAALCEREGGRLWGVSLCGPMVIADAATRSIATNQPAPEASRPPALVRECRHELGRRSLVDICVVDDSSRQRAAARAADDARTFSSRTARAEALRR
jgi:hypothetical protein